MSDERPVHVTAGDYAYDGWEIMRGHKRSGAVRVVVEDEHGRLFIHRPEQVKPPEGVVFLETRRTVKES